MPLSGSAGVTRNRPVRSVQHALVWPLQVSGCQLRNVGLVWFWCEPGGRPPGEAQRRAASLPAQQVEKVDPVGPQHRSLTKRAGNRRAQRTLALAASHTGAHAGGFQFYTEQSFRTFVASTLLHFFRRFLPGATWQAPDGTPARGVSAPRWCRTPCSAPPPTLVENQLFQTTWRTCHSAGATGVQQGTPASAQPGRAGSSGACCAMLAATCRACSRAHLHGRPHVQTLLCRLALDFLAVPCTQT